MPDGKLTVPTIIYAAAFVVDASRQRGAHLVLPAVVGGVAAVAQQDEHARIGYESIACVQCVNSRTEATSQHAVPTGNTGMQTLRIL